MAEDFSDIIEPMEFHPCDTPRGMLYYNMEILTDEQQTKLNTLKLDTIRQNHKYLAAHPEIRACVAIITKLVMRQRPRTNIHETIAEYFAKSRLDIESDINEYLKFKKPHEGISEMRLFSDYGSSGSEAESLPTSVVSDEEEKITAQESELWKNDISDIDTVAMQMGLSQSLRNMDIEYDDIPKLEPDAVIHSISVVTQGADHDGSDRFGEQERIATHVSRLLEQLKEEEERSVYSELSGLERTDEGSGSIGYSGHIPTITDYDAGYGRRRQTYISDGTEVDGSTASQDMLHHHREAKSDKIRQSDTTLPISDSETKALMEKHSVRTSFTDEEGMQKVDEILSQESESPKQSLGIKKKESSSAKILTFQEETEVSSSYSDVVASETLEENDSDKLHAKDKTISFQFVGETIDGEKSKPNSLFQLQGEGDRTGSKEFISDSERSRNEPVKLELKSSLKKVGSTKISPGQVS